MNIKEELTKLYNTMIIIETKGENTKVMADCLRFLDQLVKQMPDDTQTTIVEEGSE